eukprot:2776469-Ditylum_brightwellii.AAC.1
MGPNVIHSTRIATDSRGTSQTSLSTTITLSFHMSYSGPSRSLYSASMFRVAVSGCHNLAVN